jgi:glycosyltransferase involved in cell wall biosynthesis
MSTISTSSQAKISIIVPAFRAEGSIETCVQSLQRQDLRELEVVVVNDFSPDRTGELVARLAADDPRIRLLAPDHNLGVHGARRLGLSVSTGDYIGFVDADDFVEPNMYSTLLQRIEDDAASIAICSAALVSNGRRLAVRRVGMRRNEVVTDDILPRFCRLKFGSGVLWNKLYKREVILGPGLLELEREVDVSEDYIVNFGAFAAARTVTVCTDPLYNFVAHDSNASGQKGWSVFARLFRAYVVCLEKYAEQEPRLARLIDDLYLKQLHYPSYKMGQHGAPSPDVLEHIATSIQRMANVSPLSIYSILHALPLRYARLNRVLNALGKG